jgi:hypothetical protein
VRAAETCWEALAYLFGGGDEEDSFSLLPVPPRDRKRRPRPTPAPRGLSIEDGEALDRWIMESHPEMLRDAPKIVASCLDHFRSKGEDRVDWMATIRNWFRKEAEMRLTRGKR